MNKIENDAEQEIMRRYKKGLLPYRKFDANNWRDRLCIEYVELSQKIQKIEVQLNRRVFVEEANKLLFEQYHYMLQYSEVLFKRIYDFQIELYDYNWMNDELEEQCES